MSNNLIPSVNGISPKEGTPGTKLTIRGENLGTSAADIQHIYVGNIDVGCSVQWHSSRKLNIITSFGEGELKIIVCTKSFGRGTCDVEYFQSISQNVGLQENVSYWPPNEPKQHQVLMSYSKRSQPKHLQSEMIEDIQDVMLGHHNVPTSFVLSDDELLKFYKGRGSTALTEPDFSAILFLLKYHYRTNYQDLVRTLDIFKTVMANDKMKEPISIVKANLYTIFQCLECLETLKKKIDDEKTTTREMSGAFAEKNLALKLEESKKIAHYMYEEVLKRRDYADSVRSALSVMQRFQFLFNLPHSIRDNIGKGEYNLVIDDYLRARSLFGTSDIRLFQQVYKDVVKVIDKFKEMLRRQLLEMPKKTDAVKVTIRLLRRLDIDYDPVWTCLESQRDWILQAVRKANTNAFSHAPVASLLPSSPLTPPPPPLLLLDKPSSSTGQNTARNATVQLVDELNKIWSETFHETWSLACYFLDDQPLQKTQRRTEVELLVRAISSAYCSKMRDTLFPSGSSTSCNLTSGWMVYCLQHVRTALETVAMADLPVASSSILIGLLEELRVRSVRAVLQHAEQDIGALAYKENWNSEITDRYGAVTRLPVLYRNIMLTAFSDMARIIHSRHKMEAPVCSSPEDQLALSGWISGAMTAFNRYIDTILDRIYSRTCPGESTIPNSPNEDISSDQSGVTDSGVSNLTVSHLLLMTNNVRYCMTVVNKDIADQIRHHQIPRVDSIFEQVQLAFAEQHRRLVDKYMQLRLDSLSSQLEAGIRVGGYDWRTVSRATRARTYVHTALAGLSQAHSELQLISPHLSRSCVTGMLAKLVETVYGVVEACDRALWSRNGHMQLALDLGLLELVLIALVSSSESKAVASTEIVVPVSKEAAVSLINIMRGAPYRLTADEASVVKSALERERQSVRLLLQGFQDDRC